ncbi:MAG: transposase [Planctomycetaceae bacterium]
MQRPGRLAYPTDLTVEQWAVIEPLIPPARNHRGGRPRSTSMREVVNTVLYLNRTGCQWTLKPRSSVRVCPA